MTMVHLLERLYKESNHAITELQKKLQGENTIGPLQQRLQILLGEFHYFSSYSLQEANGSRENLKYFLSVLYRDAESINEMYKMMQRTDPVSLRMQIDELKSILTELVPYITNIFGSYESLYIVTPQFQRLSGLWK